MMREISAQLRQYEQDKFELAEILRAILVAVLHAAIRAEARWNTTRPRDRRGSARGAARARAPCWDAECPVPQLRWNAKSYHIHAAARSHPPILPPRGPFARIPRREMASSPNRRKADDAYRTRRMETGGAGDTAHHAILYPQRRPTSCTLF